MECVGTIKIVDLGLHKLLGSSGDIEHRLADDLRKSHVHLSLRSRWLIRSALFIGSLILVLGSVRTDQFE